MNLFSLFVANVKKILQIRFRHRKFQIVDNPALRNKYIYNNILFIILFNGGHM
ncbi:hypothetical protein ELI_3839 [Eubacterium callanderi]|uniref:Uncharacterized protein n=1 Tax=Eubacterium callanderi TaxID=53442 RepID=E3GGI1_9FIRM|nr:hypothetical protein ELI_3839 [Eubacterium callanderi]